MGIFNKKEIADINARLNKLEATLAGLVKESKPTKAPAVKKVAKKTTKKTTRKKKGKSE